MSLMGCIYEAFYCTVVNYFKNYGLYTARLIGWINNSLQDMGFRHQLFSKLFSSVGYFRTIKLNVKTLGDRQFGKFSSTSTKEFDVKCKTFWNNYSDQAYSRVKACHLSSSWGPNYELLEHHSTMVSSGLRGAFKWVPIMQRGMGLSDGQLKSF